MKLNVLNGRVSTLVYVSCAMCLLFGCGPKQDRAPLPAPQVVPESPATPARPAAALPKPAAPVEQPKPKPTVPVEQPKPKPAVSVEEPSTHVPAAVVAEVDRELAAFGGVSVSINELARDMDLVLDEYSEPLKRIKQLCKANDLRPHLTYQPCFVTTQAKFLVRARGPWSWSFVVEKSSKDVCDCVHLDMTGDAPVFTVTKAGQDRFAETAMIPLGFLVWSIEDATRHRVGHDVTSPFLKPGRVTASVAMPSGDCPQFLDKMFDINLIASTGQLDFLPGNEFYFQPVGRSAVKVPLFEYYTKKREEKEKKIGKTFGTNARPSPIKDAIGMIVYMEIVQNMLEKSDISDRNDTGFDFYIENADKRKIVLYTARP